MQFFSIFMLGMAMATDAFAAALGKGAAMTRPRLPEAMRVGLIFGVVESITPVIGWLIGSAASRFVQGWDHWITFGLLGALGAHMIWKSFHPNNEAAEAAQAARNAGMFTLALTGLATSIDAMAVGVGLAFIETPIWLVATMIGLCTSVMVTIGIMLGRVLGELIGRRAELAGGVVLVLVGAGILYEHLSG